MQFGVREHERYRFSCPVVITLVDEDNCPETSIRGESINISLYGLLVDLPAPIPVCSKVFLRCGGVPVSGNATIRHCSEFQSRYRIGVRLDRSLLNQNIPGVDEILIKSLWAGGYPLGRRRSTWLAVRLMGRLWRTVRGLLDAIQ